MQMLVDTRCTMQNYSMHRDKEEGTTGVSANNFVAKGRYRFLFVAMHGLAVSALA